VSEAFTARVQIDGDRWLAFGVPALVLRADAAAGVRPALLDVERLTRDRGLHAVGFLSYEAGGAFGLCAHPPASGCPLVWFALFPPEEVQASGPPRTGDYSVGALAPSRDRSSFLSGFSRIKEHIAAGDSYQVNYTFAVEGTFAGDPAALCADLVLAQQGRYSAYVDTGDLVICSASPELFVEVSGLELRMRPMKGTARRGLTTADDHAARERLFLSPKDRAENVMVVDMVRNDLGRIATVGSVSVTDLFAVERYPNVWQMTSTVIARSDAPLDAIFQALFPSASITGAPKVRTMEIVHALEGGPRGVYTGAIGHVAPDGSARFNVAIRTAVVDRRRGTVSFGVGSGIVWDSDADAEYDECLLKGSILGRPPAGFDLLETLLWTPDSGFVLLDAHLARLSESADYFGRPVSKASVRQAIEAAVAGSTVPQRVRLLVNPQGAPRVEVRPHVPNPGPVRLRLAAESIDARDIRLYHKTTARDVYDAARAATRDCDDVVLWNRGGQVTETTVANIVVEVNGSRVTPPVSCGLLAGTLRAALLASGSVTEEVVPVEVLRRASRLWVVNSVHGERPAVLVS
jgi:para-aminobenzoate synthetase / 4-amino-4-deoxychorismate lyase